MARTKAKTSSVNRGVRLGVSSAVPAYIRDLDKWPRSWMGLEKDLPPAEQLLTELRPFIEQLTSSNLSPKTIRRHVDNLWLLGGEIIRNLHEDPPRRKLSAERLLRKAVYEDGGPLIHTGSEDEQRFFDSTCRKLHRFLSQPRR